MNKIKKGSSVVKKAGNKEIVFVVEKIILEKRIYSRKNSYNNMKTGKIVHLDGDKRYMEKSYKYYKKLGLNAVVKFVPEEKQEYIIKDLISRYRPDILVITGHDGMIKKRY